MNDFPEKRGPGRPRKSLEEKQAERLGKIHIKALERSAALSGQQAEMKAAETFNRAEKPTPQKYKMKAKPNWEEIDPSYVESQDRLHIDRSEWPEGFDLQWVRYEIYGKEDQTNVSSSTRMGWTPVHQSDFGGRWDGRWLLKGSDANITYGGLALMARPEELSQKARIRENRAAREQIEIKERAMLGGDLPRVTLDAQHKSALNTNKIGRSYEQIKVPED